MYEEYILLANTYQKIKNKENSMNPFSICLIAKNEEKRDRLTSKRRLEGEGC